MRISLMLVWLILSLAACQSPEVLVARDGNVPSGVDLSGEWSLLADIDATEREIREAIRITDGIKDDALFRPSSRQTGNRSRRSRSSVDGGLVYVFLELGESLKLTQTPDGLFISFDRSVVEEYRFGEQRMVSVGQAQAQRVTGWLDDALMVETLGRNRMKLTERWRLRESGRILERTIIFRSRELEEVVVTQRFQKVVR